jgi:hypothetical protein
MIMPVQIELPERLIDALENRARQLHSSIQEVAIEAIEEAVAPKGTSAGGNRAPRGPGVHLPLIRSAKPGSLRSLTNAEIDEILGG